MIHVTVRLWRDNHMIDLARSLETVFSTYRLVLPSFLEGHCMDPDSSWFSPGTEMIYEKQPTETPFASIYGNGWLFDSQAWTREGRPLPERLGKICAYIVTGVPLTPIFAIQTDHQRCFVNDGNHRIYAAYVMGLETVPLIVGRPGKISTHSTRGTLPTPRYPNNTTISGVPGGNMQPPASDR